MEPPMEQRKSGADRVNRVRRAPASSESGEKECRLVDRQTSNSAQKRMAFSIPEKDALGDKPSHLPTIQ